MRQLLVMLLVIVIFISIIYAVAESAIFYYVEDHMAINEQVELVENESGVCHLRYCCEGSIRLDVCDIDGNEICRMYINENGNEAIFVS